MFVDASALSAIMLREPERAAFMDKLAGAKGAHTSAIAVWETMRAMVRVLLIKPEAARIQIEAFLQEAAIRIVPIGAAEQAAAIEAFARFGKGRHPARLNMGDCFAYACAQTHALPLLFKGDDFPQTDILPA